MGTPPPMGVGWGVSVGEAVWVGVGEGVEVGIGLGVTVGDDVEINVGSVWVDVAGDVVCTGTQPMRNRKRTRNEMLYFIISPPWLKKATC